jgi:hypothetical protein
MRAGILAKKSRETYMRLPHIWLPSEMMLLARILLMV